MSRLAIDPRLANRVLCKRDLARFVRQAWHVVEPGIDLAWNWHIDAVCTHLQAVTRAITNPKLPPDMRDPGPEIRRLVINIPPGHMKSLMVSVFWPAWMWAGWPWLRYVFSSYGLDLAMRDSVKTRDVINSDWYQQTFQPEWTMKQDSDSKQVFLNTMQGARQSVSVGSGATGRRGDLVCVDDPLNAVDARSEVKLKEAIWWWDKAMSSRLNDPRTGARMIIMQRLHEEDLSGHVATKRGTAKYTFLNLPSEFEIARKCRVEVTGWEDPRKIEGELLFPQMFDRQALDEAKEDMGGEQYAGQHQQRPAPAEGGFFKRRWFRYYRRIELENGQWCYVMRDPINGTTRRVLEDDCWTLLVADTAMKEKTMNDFWAAGIWHVERVMNEDGYQTGTTMFLRHVWRERCTAPEGEKRLQELYERWKPNYVGIEDKASGTAVIQRFVQDGLPVRAIKADTDKVTRASTAQVRYENGRVWLPLDAEWLEPYETELLVFPNGSNDDQVDMTSHGINFANDKDLWLKPQPEKFHHATLGSIAGHDEV